MINNITAATKTGFAVGGVVFICLLGSSIAVDHVYSQALLDNLSKSKAQQLMAHSIGDDSELAQTILADADVYGVKIYSPEGRLLKRIGETFNLEPNSLSSPRLAGHFLYTRWEHIGSKGIRYAVPMIEASTEAASIRKMRLGMLLTMILVAFATGLAGFRLVEQFQSRPLRRLIHSVRRIRRDGAIDELPEPAETNSEVALLQKEFSHMIKVHTMAEREVQRQSQELEHLAMHDVLTDLPNRSLFKRELQRIIMDARSRGGLCNIMAINLDGFKVFNDIFGQRIGDAVLIGLGHRLRDEFPQHLVARTDSDNFALLITETLNERRLTTLANEVLKVINERLDARGTAVQVTACVGVASFPEDGNNVDELLSNATYALQEAKQKGPETAAKFDNKMKQRIREQLELSDDLDKALQRGEFVLYYQPKMDLRSRRIIGAEALIRWKHPLRGLVPPDLFIPAVEASGLIVPIGNWIIESAARQVAVWNKAGLRGLKIAVNISPVQLQAPDLIATIRNVHAQYLENPAQLELEITESAIMHDPHKTIKLLAEMRATGSTLAIDDFGTGYSSLAYLKQFPVQTLKIDQAFVKNVTTDANDQAISSAVVRLGKHFGLKLVAEGIEDEKSLQMLLEMGCDIGQGYHIGRPMPTQDFSRWLINNRGNVPLLKSESKTDTKAQIHSIRRQSQ